MPSIPNLNWGEQGGLGPEGTDQEIGCAFCAFDAPAPGTIFFIRGTTVCATHREPLLNQEQVKVKADNLEQPQTPQMVDFL